MTFKPISFSGYKKYMMCPKMYQYHYVDKDRPPQMTSALVFGSLMDGIINELLLGETTDPELLLLDRINDIIRESKPMYFYKEDFDVDLVNKDDVTKLAQSLGWKGDDIGKAITSFLKDQDDLSPKQYKLMHIACWSSLQTKGIAMIDGFIKWVMPKIAEVHDVQKHLVSKAGDIHGYLDFTCTMTDGRKVLFDVKTSKSSYEYDAVLKSPQLALYCGIEKYDYAGYIVLNKTLKKNKVKTCSACPDVLINGGNAKKCPDCGKIMDFTVQPTSYVQLLVDKMPEHNINLTAEAIRDTIESIRQKRFPRNLDTCFWMYGRPCPYVNKCWGKK